MPLSSRETSLPRNGVGLPMVEDSDWSRTVYRFWSARDRGSLAPLSRMYARHYARPPSTGRLVIIPAAYISQRLKAQLAGVAYG
jgi:hypothetical protein